MGKFLPPHLGHLHLVDAARGRADRVTVLVGTRPEDVVPGELRAAWMHRLRPDTEVVRVLDETPPSPEDEGYWEIWLDSIARNAPPDLDAVFSSEDYGEEIARRLGIGHVCVDPARTRFPVSGTAVRRDPFAHWPLLPEPVRAYYCRRVAVLGPESTGKSTLARRLAEHFGAAWVDEYGREHTDAVDMSRFALDDILAIAREQARREDEAAARSSGLLVCDTELITTQVWSEIYFGAWPAWVEAESRRRRYDLLLLLDVDVPWVDDGTREFPALRRWHFDRLRGELDARGLTYHVLSGGYDERFAQAAGLVSGIVPR